MLTKPSDRRAPLSIVPVALALLLLTHISAFAQAGPPSRVDTDVTIQAVQIRPGVTVDIHLKVFVNEAQPCLGRTILAVPGFAHTAATFGPLAEAVFASTPHGHYACRIVAIDFPGHGASGLPSLGLPFGFLSLADYVTVLLASLEHLPTHGIRPSTLLAHSQGGLIVQLAQQRLKDGATTLRESFNVSDVVLMASVGPRQVPWFFADSGIALSVLSGFLNFTDVLGFHAAIPDTVWPAIFFSNLGGEIAPGAPALVDVARFNAPEPLFSALELIGALELLLGPPPIPRPSVDAGIFAATTGTTLHTISFENDQIIRPEEQAALYTYLTGAAPGTRVVVVDGQFAVHDTYVSDPEGLLETIAGRIPLH